MAICYNCGKELTEEDHTVEHVPAKNVYDGFDNEFKSNRITVPACFGCNNQFSKIDQEIRDALAVRTEDIEDRRTITEKGVRSIMRRRNWIDRAHFDVNGNVIAVDFSYDDLKQIHIKNFKALFFRKYGIPVPSDWRTEIISLGDENLTQTALVLNQYIRDGKQWEVSGHESVFKFIIKDISEDRTKGIPYESGDLEKMDAVAALMVYHNDIPAIVLAAKPAYVEKCRPKGF
jgi:hypothetical protein